LVCDLQVFLTKLKGKTTLLEYFYSNQEKQNMFHKVNGGEDPKMLIPHNNLIIAKDHFE
jgi:hypothetical protein